MIAPTNCNPDCDCAQRMVRCQRAAPVSRDSDHPWLRNDKVLEQLTGFELEPPPYVIPASLGIAPVSCVEVTPDGTAEIPATDIVIGGDGKVYRADYSEIEGDGKPTHIDVPKMTGAELLAALEKEFPATMGIAPFVASENNTGPAELKVTEIPLAGTEFLTATSKYDGACGPWMLVGYDRTILRQRLISAFRACELDCGMWSDNALQELADIAIATLEAV